MTEERDTAADWLPRHEFAEHHEITVDATPLAVEQAVRSLSLGDVAAVKALWLLRTVPARLARRSAPAPESGPLLDQLVRLGGVVLVDRPGRIVAGLGGQFWRVSGRLERFSSAEEFEEWDAAGSCKSTVDFVWSDSRPVRLETTTLVHVPTDTARRSFARYWRVVRLASGLIRILLLRAVRRRAEAVL